MKTRFMIPITDETYQALVKLAEREYRTPRQQAVMIICQRLEELGLLEPQHKEDKQNDE